MGHKGAQKQNIRIEPRGEQPQAFIVLAKLSVLMFNVRTHRHHSDATPDTEEEESHRQYLW